MSKLSEYYNGAYEAGAQQALIDSGLVKVANYSIYPPGSVTPGATMAVDPVTKKMVNISGVTYTDVGPDNFRGMDPKTERAFKAFNKKRMIQMARSEKDIARYLKSQQGIGGGAFSRLGRLLASRGRQV